MLPLSLNNYKGRHIIPILQQRGNAICIYLLQSLLLCHDFPFKISGFDTFCTCLCGGSRNFAICPVELALQCLDLYQSPKVGDIRVSENMHKKNDHAKTQQHGIGKAGQQYNLENFFIQLLCSAFHILLQSVHLSHHLIVPDVVQLC